MLTLSATRRAWTRISVIVCAALVVATSAFAQNRPAVDARAEVTSALYAASATQVAAERAADARLRAQATEIERLRREGRASRAQIAELEERYVADLAERDRVYAQEIAAFRAAVEDIASTSEGAAALARFNAGDEIGALAVLDQLIDARERARQVRANIETAAERRRVATLALEARARGRLDTAAVIVRYLEVTRLDPGVHRDWIELSRLYVDAGNLLEARRAAEQAAQTAGDDRSRINALVAIGDVLRTQGDLNDARARYEESLRIGRHLATQDPGSAALARVVSISLDRVGDVLHAQGELGGARASFEESLAIRQRSAAANPSSSMVQRDISVSLNKVGDVLVDQGDFNGARTRFEASLAIAQRLSAADPDSAEMQHDVSGSLERIGDVLRTQGELSSARSRYEESLAIRQRIAAADPGSARLQDDLVSILERVGGVLRAQGELISARARFEESLAVAQRLAATDPSSERLQRNVYSAQLRLGDVLIAQHDTSGARAHLEESLRIAQRLAVADPTSARAQRDLIISYAQLNQATGDRYFASRALEIALGMQERGMLSPADSWMIPDLRRLSER